MNPQGSPEPLSVFVAVPCLDGRPYMPHVASVVREVGHLCELGIPCTYVPNVGCSLIGESRNALVRVFMQSPHTHLLWWDADVEAQAGSVARLLLADKPVIGAVGVKKTDGLSGLERFNCLPKESGEMFGSLMPMDFIATMFLLIHKNVFSGISAHSLSSFGGWFDAHDPKDVRLGWTEDYAFCRRAREAGFEIWADTSIRINHYGMKAFSGDFPAYWLSERERRRVGVNPLLPRVPEVFGSPHP